MTAPAGRPSSRVEVGGKRVTLTNLDKPLWPQAGFTKAMLIDYYRRVAPALLPHLRDRPVTLVRFPDGVGAEGWYQTNCRGRPSWMAVHEVRSRQGTTLRYCVVNDLPSLLWVANQGTVELHPLLQTTPGPGATEVVFDLDPGPPASVVECAAVALRLRAALLDRGLESYPKTSGWKGVHLHVPIGGMPGFERTKAFARELAEALAGEEPATVVARHDRSARVGKVSVDWRQNDPNRSLIAPYSPRSSPRPRVAAPVTWEEIREVAEERAPEALRFDPAEVLERLERMGDPLARMTLVDQTLPG